MDRSTKRTTAVADETSTTLPTQPPSGRRPLVKSSLVRSRTIDPTPDPTSPPPVTPVPPAPQPPSGPPSGGGPRGWPRGLVAALVVAVLVISGAIALNVTTGALQNLNPFKNGVVQERTIDRSSPAVLKAINDLGEFQAANGYYELVVNLEKDVHPVPSFLAGEKVLFIAAGTVGVGVDLRGLADGAVKVNSERTTATITLPKPTLAQPVLDLKNTYIYNEQRGLFNRIKDAVSSKPGDQQQLYALATQKLTGAAQRSNELITRGETNTRAMLQGLLRSLGFTSVTIQFG
jgi:hypothetical protein